MAAAPDAENAESELSRELPLWGKRSRVSFSHVSTRTFEKDDSAKSVSSQNTNTRMLSPLQGNAATLSDKASDATTAQGAVEARGVDTSISRASYVSAGEASLTLTCTASMETVSDSGDLSLGNLLRRDEADAAAPRRPVSTPQSKAARESGQLSPRSPFGIATPSSCVSPWDLYESFKKEQADGRSRLSSLGPGRRPLLCGEGRLSEANLRLAESPPRQPPRQPDSMDSSPSIDMRALIHASRPVDGDFYETEVPEGRKSFNRVLPMTATSDSECVEEFHDMCFPAAVVSSSSLSTPSVTEEQPALSWQLPPCFPKPLSQQEAHQDKPEHLDYRAKPSSQQSAQQQEQTKKSQELSSARSSSAKEQLNELRCDSPALTPLAPLQALAELPPSLPTSHRKSCALDSALGDSLPPLFSLEPLESDMAIDFERVNREFEERIASRRAGAHVAPLIQWARHDEVNKRPSNEVVVPASAVVARTSTEVGAKASLGTSPLAAAAVEEDATGEVSLFFGEESTDLAALPAASSLQYVSAASPSAVRTTSRTGKNYTRGVGSWEDFLRHCGISFPAMEQEAAYELAPSVARLDAACARSPQEGGTAGQLTAQIFSLHRGRSLEDALMKVTSWSQTSLQEYRAKVAAWNAGQIGEAATGFSELSVLRSRVDSWRSSCKDAAWLQWYGMKKEWLNVDLGHAQQHTATLKEELSRQRGGQRRLEGILEAIKGALRSGRDLNDLRCGALQLGRLGAETARAAEAERSLLAGRAAVLSAAAASEDAALRALEERVAQARAKTQRESEATHEARRNFLRAKALRVELEKRRCAQTCAVERASSTSLWLGLRAGALIQVEQAHGFRGFGVGIASVGAAGRVRVRLGFRGEEEEESLAAVAEDVDLAAKEVALRAALLRFGWRASIAKTCGGSASDESKAKADAIPAQLAHTEIEVPYGELPRILCRLNVAAIRVGDQLSALAAARAGWPGLVGFDVEPCEREGLGPRLRCHARVVVARSHTVTPGGLLAPVDPVANPARVDAVRCTLEFDLNPDTFPEASKFERLSAWRGLGLGRARDGQMEAAAAKASAQLPPAVPLSKRLAAVLAAATASV